ncbi:uncharacterized protein LOC127761149 [Oryza glaberrima]|uniref:Uncharacterized protein n=1 Tax=Oryza glaberrima TaxID=4538 RepID=I1NX65_ORYGL|nr:uncharacterized protein LOC127761149 [Oryza glaberrima]
MSRRFLHLLVKKPTAWGSEEFALRRIDMSRFFPPRKPTGGGDGSAAADRPRPAAAAAAAMVDAQLPRAGEAIYRPQGHGWGRCGATILGGGKDKVVGVDGECRSFLLILYRCGAHAVRLLPAMRAPKRSPIAFTVGDGVYVMEAAPPEPPRMRGAEHRFEALVHGLPPAPPRGGATAIEDWHWRSLPAPPYVLDPGGDDGPARVAAHTVVGDSQIWVSTERHGTFSFDTASGAWSKAGDWALLFRGRAEHVPEHSLWFGFSPHRDGHLCASDLTATPPSLRHTWSYRPSRKDRPAPVASYLVPLGGGRLCVAELFETTRVEVGGRPLDTNNKKKKAASKTTTRRWGFSAAAAGEEEEEEETEVRERFAVVTGVEVEASASGKAPLRMARRAVRRYVLSTETVVTREARRRSSRRRGRPKKDDDETLHWVF